jgi:predicted  nucleic acid-binding Zn-ribbon protein
MTTDELIALLLAGGLGALGKTVIDALRERANAKRDDRRQRVEESKTAVDSSHILIESAEKIVALQNEQIDDLKRIITEQQAAFQKRIDAQAAALAAYETRLDREMEARRRGDILTEDLRGQLSRLRDELADVKAAFKLADQNQQALREENKTIKEHLFQIAVGVAALVKQVTDAGLVPVYVLDVPLMTETHEVPVPS